MAAAAAAEAAEEAAAAAKLPPQKLPRRDATSVELAWQYLEGQRIQDGRLAAVLEGMLHIHRDVKACVVVAAFQDIAGRAYASPRLKRAALHLADALHPTDILAKLSMAAEALHAFGKLGVWPRRLVVAIAAAAVEPDALRDALSGSLCLVAKGLASLQAARNHLRLLVFALARRCYNPAAPPVSVHEAIGAVWAASIADADELAPQVVTLCDYAARVVGPDGCGKLGCLAEVRLAVNMPV